MPDREGFPPGVPAWIDLAQDDPDAAARAVSARVHGGTVVAEPFDVPPVRSAVIRDPSGARLTVSAFRPG